MARWQSILRRSALSLGAAPLSALVLSAPSSVTRCDGRLGADGGCPSRWISARSVRPILPGWPVPTRRVNCESQPDHNNATETGFLGSLTASEQAALDAFRSRVPAVKLWGQDLQRGSGTGGDVVLLKFLRARKFDVDAAFTMLENCLAWRKEKDVDECRSWPDAPDAFQGVDIRGGVDNCGRPVQCVRAGIIKNFDKAFEDTRVFINYRVKLTEDLISGFSFRPGEPETWTVLQDFTGLGLMPPKQLRSALKEISAVYEANYPEFKGPHLFVNFPSSLAFFFRALSVFIPERTKRKFVVLDSERMHEVYKFIPGANVPVECGGFLDLTVPSSTPVQHMEIKSRSIEHVFHDSQGRTCLQLRVLKGPTLAVRVEQNGQVLLDLKELHRDDGLQTHEITAIGKVKVVFDNAHSRMTSKVAAWRFETR